MMNVCQKCGDEGYIKELIYCVQCKVSAEHCYCLDILPKSEKEKVAWTCEECAAKETKVGLISPRKSKRISQAAEVRLSRKQLRKQISFRSNKARVHTDSFPEAKQSLGDRLLSNLESKKLPAIDVTFGNEEVGKRKRTLLLEDRDMSDEESEPVKTEAFVLDSTDTDGQSEPVEIEAFQLVSTVTDSRLNTSSYPLSLESDKYEYSQPMKDPIWRGSFNINNVKHQTSIGLVAHLTRKGCSKACDEVNVLPLLLAVEILSKSDAWPQRFQISPPSDNSIGFYFFPEYESDEKVYDTLLDDMIEHNLALKAVTEDAKLLVFSSRELPSDQWRFCRKYYMWGVLEPN